MLTSLLEAFVFLSNSNVGGIFVGCEEAVDEATHQEKLESYCELVNIHIVLQNYTPLNLC